MILDLDKTKVYAVLFPKEPLSHVLLCKLTHSRFGPIEYWQPLPRAWLEAHVTEIQDSDPWQYLRPWKLKLPVKFHMEDLPPRPRAEFKERADD